MFSFIETRLFTKLVLEYLSDEEYGSLQKALMRDPDAGSVVPGSGGVRKLRWAAPGRGKHGGYRVIYLCATDPRCNMDADDVPEERCREHSCTRAPTDSEGGGR